SETCGSQTSRNARESVRRDDGRMRPSRYPSFITAFRGVHMIDVYTWPTPNGHKIHIALEEMGLSYRIHGVNIRTGEQFKPEFLKMSPNTRIPAIVDSEGPGGKPISIFESGAILLYLASKSGKLMPADPRAHWACTQWLMWQMGGLGPMMGQANHFR